MKKIAVITRTKNRSLFLARCLDSLLKQTYKNFTWVIVNDNGDHGCVDEIVTMALAQGIDTVVIHRTQSIGVAAAANNGIAESDSDFIHIHDDDDTLQPEFYQEVVSFLDSKPNYMGVVTSTNRVDEEIINNKIKIIDSFNYYRFDSTLFIADLIWKNQFSPISFVHRRCVYEKIGLFDESLPVLEDWDFNLRFSREYDIGAIPKFLANYHWRLGPNTGGMTQTVVSGTGLHQEYTAVVRNKFLRQDLAEDKFGIGALMTLGRFHQLQSNSLKLIGDKVEAHMVVRGFFRKIQHYIRSLRSI